MASQNSAVVKDHEKDSEDNSLNLQKLTTQFEDLFNFMPDPAVILDQKGTFLALNKCATDTIGYPKVELIGKNFMEVEFLTDESKTVLAKNVHLRMAGAKSSPYEAKSVSKDGVETEWEVRASIFEYEGKICDLVLFRDITERKKIEGRLREKTNQLFEKEQRLQNIIESSPNAILITSLDATVRECNKATLDLTGFKTKDEIIGRKVTELLRPSSSDATSNYIRKIIENGKIENIPSIVANQNNEEIPIEITAGLIIEANGQPQSLVAVVNNVSEKKRLIDELQKSRERYKMLFADAPIALWEIEFSQAMGHIKKLRESGVTDYKAYFREHPEVLAQLRDKMRIIEVNKATESLFEMPGAEVNAFFSRSDLVSESLSKLFQNVFEFAEGKRFFETEGVLKTPRGTKNISIQAFLTFPKNNECTVIVSMVDISEKYKLMEMKEQFVTHITHELRTPLVSITGYLDYILKGNLGNVPEKIDQKLQIVRRNSLRLSDLTNDLLDARRIEAGKFELNVEPVSVRQILDDCLKEIEPSTSTKQQVVRSSFPDSQLLVSGDRVRLTQIIMNLFSNASKYTPHNGEISIGVEETDDWLSIRIADTGTGLRKEDLPKVFEPFANIKKSTNAQSTGLGLYVTKGLIEEHGGKIWVESEGENKGSTFMFTIPKMGKKQQRVDGATND